MIIHENRKSVCLIYNDSGGVLEIKKRDCLWCKYSSEDWVTFFDVAGRLASAAATEVDAKSIDSTFDVPERYGRDNSGLMRWFISASNKVGLGVL